MDNKEQKHIPFDVPHSEWNGAVPANNKKRLLFQVGQGVMTERGDLPVLTRIETIFQ